MAFGFGFGFQFGTRGGGGSSGDPTAITPANADAFLASLGLTQAGTGTTWGETGEAATPLYEVAAGKVPLGYNAALGVWGPIVNPSGENLALYGGDATNAAWSKTNITPTLQTGSLSDAGAANGHTLLTATDANGTCLQAITSGSAARVTKIWLARETGSGTIQITQNNGSTWTTVSLTSNPQPFDIAAATLANPIIGIRIATSGDAVRLYRTQHQVSPSIMRPSIGPTAGSAVTSNGRTLRRTLGVAPSAISIEFVLAPVSGKFRGVFGFGDGTASNRLDLRLSDTGEILQGLYNAGGSGTDVKDLAVVLNTPCLVAAELGADVQRMRLNNGTWQTFTDNGMPSGTALRVGERLLGADEAIGVPFLAFRDNLGNLLDGNRGWNHSILDNWT